MCRHRIVRTREEKLSHADSQTQKLVFLSSWSHFLFQSLLLVRPFDFLVTQKKNISSCALSEIFLAGVMSDEGGKGKKKCIESRAFHLNRFFRDLRNKSPVERGKATRNPNFSFWLGEEFSRYSPLPSFAAGSTTSKVCFFFEFLIFFGNRRKANCNFVFFWLRCFSSSPSRC